MIDSEAARFWSSSTQQNQWKRCSLRLTFRFYRFSCALLLIFNYPPRFYTPDEGFCVVRRSAINERRRRRQPSKNYLIALFLSAGRFFHVSSDSKVITFEQFISRNIVFRRTMCLEHLQKNGFIASARCFAKSTKRPLLLAAEYFTHRVASNDSARWKNCITLFFSPQCLMILRPEMRFLQKNANWLAIINFWRSIKVLVWVAINYHTSCFISSKWAFIA